MSRQSRPIDEPKYRDEEWLREKYIKQQQSSCEISEKCGCSDDTILRWLKKHGIETRSRGGSRSHQKLADERWLREQYVEQQKSSADIAAELGSHSSTVLNWLDKHGIETRVHRPDVPDKRLTNGKWLREQYVEQQKSSADIAEECECSPSAVRDWLDRHGVERRARQPIVDKRLQNKRWLREQYIHQEKSSGEIATELNCAGDTVLNWLDRHGIETRGGAEGLRGREHPSYDGGPAKYGPGWNDRKKRAVRDRDDHTCQDPNCSVRQAGHLEEHGEKLHVHHLRKARDVEDSEERNAKENLITLCRDCHNRWEKMSDAGLVPEVVNE